MIALLTYVDSNIKIDFSNPNDLRKIQAAAIEFESFSEIVEIAKKNKISVIGVEPLDVIQMKLELINEFIAKKNKSE